MHVAYLSVHVPLKGFLTWLHKTPFSHTIGVRLSFADGPFPVFGRVLDSFSPCGDLFATLMAPLGSVYLLYSLFASAGL